MAQNSRQRVVWAALKEMVPYINQVQERLRPEASSHVQAFVERAEKTMEEELSVQLQKIDDVPVYGENHELNALPEERCWLVDPIDGTTNLRMGLPFFSVSIALVEKAQVLAGFVYDFNRDFFYAAARGQGTYVNHKRLRLPTSFGYDLILLGQGCSPAFLEPAQWHCRMIGCHSLSLCWVAQGMAAAYLSPRVRLIDLAAGLLIVQEAGALLRNNAMQALDDFEHGLLVASPKVVARLQTARDHYAARHS